MQRTEKYSLWFTAVFASGFVQGLLFVSGDGCYHEPQPAICQSGAAFVTLGNIASAFWGTALTSPLVYLIFLLFNRPYSFGPVTEHEKKAFLQQWSRKTPLGWTVVVIFNFLCALFILRLFQFYPWGLVEKWISGLFMSSFAGMTGSGMARALQFLRFFFLQVAQRGGRTW